MERAVALAISAKRFNLKTTLIWDRISDSNIPLLNHFDNPVHVTIDDPITPEKCWEIKKLCYDVTEKEPAVAYVDADSLFIKDPTDMWSILNNEPIHMPFAAKLTPDSTWSCPKGFTLNDICKQTNIDSNSSIHAINGGFFMWRRGNEAKQWFDSFKQIFKKLKSQHKTVRDELCMSLAFAQHSMVCSMSNTSIGVWDTSASIDIEGQKAYCMKGGLWENNIFRPYIIHFGGSRISDQYKQCVKWLTTNVQNENLKLFH